MKIYKVYTDLYYDGSDYMVKLYINMGTAEKDFHERREKGDEAYLEELDVIDD